MQFSRRDFGKLAAASVPFSLMAAKINSKINGVQIGAQSYSFRTLPLDECIKGYQTVGLGVCELYATHAERPEQAPQPPRGGAARGGQKGGPAPAAAEQKKGGPGEQKKGGPGGGNQAREDLRKWRLSVPMDHFKGVRKKFEDAGVTIVAYNYSFNDSFTDEEIDRGFEMAKALGVKIITASSTLTSAKRVAPFADKHKMIVAMHGHDNITNPNEFAKPESFEAAMAMSKYFRINLDVGHFWAAGYDPVEYIKKNHKVISTIHLKDRDRRKPNHPNTVWGEGDTPLKDVLQLLKKEKYDFPANIEYEYAGAGDAVTEVKKCFYYSKQLLA